MTKSRSLEDILGDLQRSDNIVKKYKGLAFSDLHAASPDKNDVENFFYGLVEGNDQNIAILAAAHLDVALEECIISRMIELGKNQHKKIFEGNGPLSSFASKIEIAYALGFIGKQIYQDLNLIRDIRNLFAHATIELNFQVSAVEDKVWAMNWEGRAFTAATAPTKGINRPLFLKCAYVNWRSLIFARSYYSFSTEQRAEIDTLIGEVPDFLR